MCRSSRWNTAFHNINIITWKLLTFNPRCCSRFTTHTLNILNGFLMDMRIFLVTGTKRLYTVSINSACEIVKIFTGKAVMTQDKNQWIIMLQARFKAAGSLKMLSYDTSNHIKQHKHTLLRLKACNTLVRHYFVRAYHKTKISYITKHLHLQTFYSSN